MNVANKKTRGAARAERRLCDSALQLRKKKKNGNFTASRASLARGQFNSGRMIVSLPPPPRHARPLYFSLSLSLCLCLSNSGGCHPRSELSLVISGPGATLRLPSVLPLGRARASDAPSVRAIDSPSFFFFPPFLPHLQPPPRRHFSLPSNYFDGNCFSFYIVSASSLRRGETFRSSLTEAIMRYLRSILIHFDSTDDY